MWTKFWNWLAKSSADPNAVALSVKGYITLTITGLLYISPLLHLNLGQAQLTTIGDSIIQIIVVGAGIVSAVVTIMGLARKVYLTWIHPQP